LPPVFYIRGWRTFSVKDPMENILGFAGPVVPVEPTGILMQKKQ
jgi:hypothetical protein